MEDGPSSRRRSKIGEKGTKHMSKEGTKIDRRSDTKPKYGEHKYGEVEYADTTNKKYPIDTPKHIRAAWSYINHKDNAAKYEKGEVSKIKSRIKRAAKSKGIEISSE